ncbi:MAG: hypothetical protein R3E69_04560 [Steroidobacteraceae bacterium]
METTAVPMDLPAAIPLVIGVTGHRDLVESEVPAARERVREFLASLRDRWPRTPLIVASQLAEGADLLVAEEAHALGLELVFLQPLPIADYRAQFSGPEELARFDELRAVSRVVDLTNGEAAADRDTLYAVAGDFLARYCYILLALWDGKPSASPGGTAAVVNYRLASKGGARPATDELRDLALGEADNSLVYHILVSRDRRNGEPTNGHKPLSAGYLHEFAGGRSTLQESMPGEYLHVLERTEEFNRVAKHATAGALADERAPFVGAPPAVRRCARLIALADHLATLYRRRLTRITAWTYGIGAVMGCAFVLYSKIPAMWGLIYVFFGAALATIALSRYAEYRGWHRDHLEYRALCEGLRVQFYLRVAGVRDEGRLHTGDESFLRRQDPELDWIRNAMRAVDFEMHDAGRDGISGGIEHAIETWVGSLDPVKARGSGQLGYFWHAGEQRRHMIALTERTGAVTLVFGLAAAAVLCFVPVLHTGYLKTPLVVTMGLLPLAAGLLEAWLQKSAAKELARQYGYMYRLFDEARSQLQGDVADDRRRSVLYSLGRAALAEHATWVLLNRDRKLRHLPSH